MSEVPLYMQDAAGAASLGGPGDTTPCRMTGVTLYSHVPGEMGLTPVILHGVVSPERGKLPDDTPGNLHPTSHTLHSSSLESVHMYVQGYLAHKR